MKRLPEMVAFFFVAFRVFLRETTARSAQIPSEIENSFIYFMEFQTLRHLYNHNGKSKNRNPLKPFTDKKPTQTFLHFST